METLAAALGGEFAVAADDEPLARIIGRGDRRNVAPVEQRQLQFAGLDQRADGRSAQRRDPVEAGRRDVFVDARLRNHAAVAD